MARKTLGLRKKKKYQRHNKKQPTRKRKRKGKGLVSLLRGLKSRKKRKEEEEVRFKKFTPPEGQLGRSAANRLNPRIRCAHLSQEEETASALKKLDKLIKIHVNRF